MEFDNQGQKRLGRSFQLQKKLGSLSLAHLELVQLDLERLCLVGQLCLVRVELVGQLCLDFTVRTLLHISHMLPPNLM